MKPKKIENKSKKQKLLNGLGRKWLEEHLKRAVYLIRRHFNSLEYEEQEKRKWEKKLKQ